MWLELESHLETPIDSHENHHRHVAGCWPVSSSSRMVYMLSVLCFTYNAYVFLYCLNLSVFQSLLFFLIAFALAQYTQLAHRLLLRACPPSARAATHLTTPGPVQHGRRQASIVLEAFGSYSTGDASVQRTDSLILFPRGIGAVPHGQRTADLVFKELLQVVETDTAGDAESLQFGTHRKGFFYGAGEDQCNYHKIRT